MQTIQELFEFILKQDRIIVFGNLGRYPHLLYETLASIPLIRVIIITRCGITSTNNRIRVQNATDPVHECDLVVFIEPSTLQVVEKHPLGSRAVVFTSHFRFRKVGGDWTYVCYFHGMDLEGTRDLVSRQDFPIQTKNVGLVEMDHVNVIKISGKSSQPPSRKDAYVIVDLTHFTKDVAPMFLAFWDAFDYMLEHRDSVNRWVVCFSENGRQAFTNFTQRVIDVLFCRNFEHGNVTDRKSILSLLPFYSSGIIDQTFDLKPSSFGGIRFVVPKTPEEACKTAAMYNVIPLCKNVLWIRI